MSLYARFKRRGPSGFSYASTAEEVTAGLSLGGKTVLVTGCNSGLGLETMRVLALRGAYVIGTARTEERARGAIVGSSFGGRAPSALGGKATGLACELAEPDSIRACVEAVKKIDVRLDAIVCNAGIMALPKLQQAFGYELQFFTNHIGHFMLVNGLIDILAEDGRVVLVSSAAHQWAPAGGIDFDNLSGTKGYRPRQAYGQSKFANLLFAKELARRFEGTARTANAVHPGVIATNLVRHLRVPQAVGKAGYGFMNLLVFKTVAQGAATQCYVAVHPDAAGISGEYFADCNIAKPRADAADPELARRLWEESEKIVAGI